MYRIENRSFERVDKAGRKVKVTFVKKDGEIFWIRVCTFFAMGGKLRSDYYKEFFPEKFEKVYQEECINMPDYMDEWVFDVPRLNLTAKLLNERRGEWM